MWTRSIMAKVASILLLSSAATHAQEPVSASDVQLFVQQQMADYFADGSVRMVNLQSQEILEVVPLDSHPLIFEGDGIFVACITVSDIQGNEHPVDIFIDQNEDGLKMTHVYLGDEARDLFVKMVQAGIVFKMN